MAKIFKHIYTVVVLSDSDALETDSLHILADSIDTGEDIGQFEHTSTEEVPAEQVKSELLAIGNDGTFFDSLD